MEELSFDEVLKGAPFLLLFISLLKKQMPKDPFCIHITESSAEKVSDWELPEQIIASSTVFTINYNSFTLEISGS